eukprot:gene15690-21251_t
MAQGAIGDLTRIKARDPARQQHKSPSIDWFETLGRTDVAKVGGKNASLGEMVRTLGSKGIKVPPGFATTAEAYW